MPMPVTFVETEIEGVLEVETGLFKDERRVAGKTEEGIYKKLGMSFVPPELREDRGEVEAALETRGIRRE